MRSARVYQSSLLSQYNVRGGRGHLENTSLQVARRAITVVKGPALQGHTPTKKVPVKSISCGYCGGTIWYPHASRKYCTRKCSGKAKAKAQRAARWARNGGPNKYPTKKLCAVCTKPLRDRRSTHCSVRCRYLRPRGPSQTKEAIRARQRRSAILGRLCRYCGRTDKETQFNSSWCCCTCHQQTQRRQCSKCGGPLYVNKNSRGILGCLLAYALVPGDSCKYYV